MGRGLSGEEVGGDSAEAASPALEGNGLGVPEMRQKTGSDFREVTRCQVDMHHERDVRQGFFVRRNGVGDDFVVGPVWGNGAGEKAECRREKGDAGGAVEDQVVEQEVVVALVVCAGLGEGVHGLLDRQSVAFAKFDIRIPIVSAPIRNAFQKTFSWGAARWAQEMNVKASVFSSLFDFGGVVQWF